jgi:tRNA (guanine-N7-)-methyltransferase
MHERRHIEREFGVPIAGEIVSRAQWSQTALKKLPESGPLAWTNLFGRQAPLVLDLGCGNGRFLIGSAVWRRDHDHVGVDVLPVVIRYATRRGNQRGLANLRFAVCDAATFLRRFVPAESIAEVHCYHPQPYYDARDIGRRLITPEFLLLVHRALIKQGSFFVQTDNLGYWDYIRKIVPNFFNFHERIGPWPDAPKGRTRREIIALRRGLPVFRGYGTALPGLNQAAAIEIAGQLPPPTFNADRRLRELDRIEAERN